MSFKSPYTLLSNGWKIQRSSMCATGALTCLVLLVSACGSTNPIDNPDSTSATSNVSAVNQSQDPDVNANPFEPVPATQIAQNPDSSPATPESTDPEGPSAALPEITIGTVDATPAATETADLPDEVGSTDIPSGSEEPESLAGVVVENLPPATCSTDPRYLQERMLALINEARATPRSCGEVDYVAARALSWNTTLEDAARGHSADMASVNFFSHTGSDGSSAAARVTQAGYIWRTVGENIAAGRDDAERTVNDWLASPGHCRNIMNPAFREVAVACVEDERSVYRQYWTNVLAAPR